MLLLRGSLRHQSEIQHKSSSLSLFLSSSYPFKLLREERFNPQLHSTRRTMQLKVLAILSFMALTGSAQRCLKGNNANQGESCEGVGNLICSHNLKHVVSTLTIHCNQRETLCCHNQSSVSGLSTNCISLQLACNAENKWQRSSDCKSTPHFGLLGH